jgi:hypothetical protein
MQTKRLLNFFLPFILGLFGSCNGIETAQEILEKTIASMDTIETIYYKQDMSRTNPQSLSDTIFRYREMYFERRREDSIVGVKGHWFMYVDDKTNVIYEDIYDGARLVRKNNRDSTARIYDLSKYPEFKNQHFWGHFTPYAMQHEFKYMLDQSESYEMVRLKDTIIRGNPCFQLLVKLDGKTSMPGFLIRLEVLEGNISETLFVIDKRTNYPVRMKGTSYMSDQAERKNFIDQNYYDIVFNPRIDETVYFDTSVESLKGFEIREMQPD